MLESTTLTSAHSTTPKAASLIPIAVTTDVEVEIDSKAAERIQKGKLE